MSAAASSPPPSGSKGTLVIRHLLGVVLFLVAVFLMWTTRSATLGFTPLASAGIFALFLPFILLVWPTIPLKKNPVGALLPAAIAVALILLLNIFFGSDISEVALAEGIEAPKTREPSLLTNLLYYAAIGIATSLVFFIPKGKQRRTVIINAVLTVTLVEGLFLGEEALFYRDRDRFDLVVQGTLGKSGFVPTNGYLRVSKITPSNIAHSKYNAHLDRKSYSISWTRILNPRFIITYSSDPQRLWIIR